MTHCRPLLFIRPSCFGRTVHFHPFEPPILDQTYVDQNKISATWIAFFDAWVNLILYSTWAISTNIFIMIKLVIFLFSISHHIVQESLHLLNSPTRSKQFFVFLDILLEFICMWFIDDKWLEEIFQKLLSVFQWMVIFTITLIRFIITSNIDGLKNIRSNDS